MRTAQLAIVFAALAGASVTVSASANDEKHNHGLTPPEVYLLRQVPPDKAVRIVKLDIKPYGSIDSHCHSGDEIGIVTQGTLRLRVGDAGYEEKHPGDWFTVTSGKVMMVQNVTNEPAQLYSVLVVDDDGKWLKHDPQNCQQK